ncbi:MAG: hypothetical protein M1503_05700 [Thaumarchaeota archaeon]|nr:hypothetical protein [Nitrososphaerota archaeon]MCL5317742.1 hypothetical protein [Nitrososphaerota archaeon]
MIPVSMLRFTLHAGTPIVVSGLNMLLLTGVLIVILSGIKYGRIRNVDSLKIHRNYMTAATIATIAGISFVMLPAFYRYYIDPDVEFYSTLSISTLMHAAVSGPALLLGVLFSLNRLPRNVKPWMRLTAALWISAIIVGVVLFIQMLAAV